MTGFNPSSHDKLHEVQVLAGFSSLFNPSSTFQLSFFLFLSFSLFKPCNYWAAFSERSSCICTPTGNNTEAHFEYAWACFVLFTVCIFARCLWTLCSRSWNACRYTFFNLFFFSLSLFLYIYSFSFCFLLLLSNKGQGNAKIEKEFRIFLVFFYYYTVCTHNRIRSPRLATFGRIETRWVREVGKFGPYIRYKDWLRRR